MAQFTPQPARAVTTASGNQMAANSAQFSSGGHVVVWTSGDASNATSLQSFAQIYDAQGAAVGGAIQLFTDPMFATDGAAVRGVATLADGSFAVLARSEHVDTVNHSPATWNYYQERVNANGQVVYGPAFVASASSYDQLFSSSGPVYAAPDGLSYYVAMEAIDRPIPYTFNEFDMRHYALNGSAAGAPITAGGMGTVPADAAVLAGGNVITVDDFGLYTQMVRIIAHDANGNSLSGTIDSNGNAAGGATIGTSADYYAGEDHLFPEVAALANGNALVVFEQVERQNGSVSADHWLGQLVSPTGQLVGGKHDLGIPANGNLVHLSSLVGGGVIAWWDSGAGFVAKAIDESGNASSDTVAIGSGVTSVTGTADGGFLVESSRDGGASGTDIYEQKFDAGASTSAQSGRMDVSGAITAVPTGNYDIVGSAGLDQIAFAGAHTQYTVAQGSVSGPEGSDTLSGIERVRFGDGYAIALDVSGDAGQAYRLYQAAFDRAPDLPGLGFQTNDLDMGYSLAHVAQNFIDSPEFQATYGPGLSNTDFITLLYRNVLNREPESAGLQYHLNEFAQGDTRANMLTHFSESPENQANVIGQIANGMLFIPYA